MKPLLKHINVSLFVPAEGRIFAVYNTGMRMEILESKEGFDLYHMIHRATDINELIRSELSK